MSPKPDEISQHLPHDDLCLPAALKRNKNIIPRQKSLTLLTSACAPTQSHFTSPLPCPPHSGIQPAGRASLATVHRRKRKQNLHSPCLGRASHFLPPSHNLLPCPSSPQACALRGCPNALALWSHQGTHPAKGRPAPTQPRYQRLQSGKQGWCLARPQAPPAAQPLPHAKEDPLASLALTCCPKRVPWQGWGELCLPCPGWQSPRPGAGWDPLAQSSFSPVPDGKAIQPCSPPLPFRKQLLVIQSRERFPREPHVHLRKRTFGVTRRSWRVKVARQAGVASTLPSIARKKSQGTESLSNRSPSCAVSVWCLT